MTGQPRILAATDCNAWPITRQAHPRIQIGGNNYAPAGRIFAPPRALHPRTSMPDHKFKIGQTLTFNPHRMNAQARPGKCKIMRLVSNEGENPQYRVKCVTETFERVVWESELE
jgi:hypothetical protein